jgi:hypothetical protein
MTWVAVPEEVYLFIYFDYNMVIKKLHSKKNILKNNIIWKSCIYYCKSWVVSKCLPI